MTFRSICLLALFGATSAVEFTLSGECPAVIPQKKLDYTKFNGTWYTVETFASDGHVTADCATLEFLEDNLGFTLRETYVEQDQGIRTQKSYLARVDPTFDAGDNAKFILSYEFDDKVLQYPFYILSTDYDDYAIAYTCKTLKMKIRTHYVFVWVLSRTKTNLEGDRLARVNDALAQAGLIEHRTNFIKKDFSDTSCGFQKKMETDHFANNFW